MKSGFTLIEVMISVVMLSLLVVAIFPVVGWLINKSAQYKYDTEAAEILQEGTEAVYNIMLATTDWNSLIVGEDFHTQEVVAGNPDQFALTFSLGETTINGKFDRWSRIENICRNAITGIRLNSCSDPTTVDPKSKLVTTFVEWQEPSGTKTVKSELLVVKM